MKEQYIFPKELVVTLRELITQYGSWGKAKPHTKPLWVNLGRVPSAQDIYNAVNDISYNDIIAPCGKEKRFDGFYEGYRFCGTLQHCPCAADNTKVKSEITFLKKYGAKRPTQNATVMAKTKRTNLTKYGVECVLSSSLVREKIKQTNISRFGYDNPASSSAVKEKIKKTNLIRYGVEHTLQSESVIKKTKNTIMEKYGVDHIGKSGVIKAKIKQTNLSRYGKEHTFQTTEFKEKSKATLLEKYGVDQVYKSKTIQDKIRATNQEKYGADKPFQSKIVQDKVAKTAMECYGVDHQFKSPEFRSKVISDLTNRFGRHSGSLRISQESHYILSDADRLSKFAENKSFHTISKELDVHPTTVLKRWHQHELPVFQSRYEKLIDNWLVDLGIEHLKTRKVIQGFEIDFFLPEYNLAVEFNGIYWHSDTFKDRLYHRRKYEACRDANIRLVMINEDEWIERETAIKSRIVNLVGASAKGPGARELTVREIKGSIANEFFNKHHIQGRTGVILFAIGAFNGEELISCMAFNQQRGTGVTELIRFCSDGGSYAGLFTKMFKHSIEYLNTDKIISFADLRYSSGAVYRNNGFDLVNEISPDYRYVKGIKTYHKSSFTKIKISSKFNIDMQNMTERQAMNHLGFSRIYDCGKLKFEYRCKNS